MANAANFNLESWGKYFRAQEEKEREFVKRLPPEVRISYWAAKAAFINLE